MSLFFVGDLNILADKKLSAFDKIVYYALVSYMNKKDGKCFPRYATIRKRTGLSIATIQRSVQNLAKLKLLTKKRLSSTNQYLLSQQIALETLVKKRVITLSEGSDNSNRGVLIKPYNLTNNRYVNKYNKPYYRKSFSPPPTANHSKLTIDYEGETYRYIGTEDHWIELENKARNKRIMKHKFKDIIKKKFSAAARNLGWREDING